MLGLENVKGSLQHNADADLVILSESQVRDRKELQVDQVWKFGSLAFKRQI
jgi:N-acetylglucosamine-6-phosphate deacetylase